MKLYTSKHVEENDKVKPIRKRKLKEVTEEPVTEPKEESEPVEPVEPVVEVVEKPLEPIPEEVEIYVPPSAPPTPPPEEQEPPKPKSQPRKKREIKEVEPPKWFKTFMSNTRVNEQTVKKVEKKPRKEIKKEAVQHARESWQDAHIRDRFTNQSDQHLNQLNHLYGQIFKR